MLSYHSLVARIIKNQYQRVLSAKTLSNRRWELVGLMIVISAVMAGLSGSVLPLLFMGAGFAIQIAMLVSDGIKRRGFAGQTRLVAGYVGKTCLYILLPAALITALLLILRALYL